MENIDEPQNAGIPGDEIADVSVSLVNTDNEATQSSPISDRVPLPWIGAMPPPELRCDGGGQRRRLSRSSLHRG